MVGLEFKKEIVVKSIFFGISVEVVEAKSLVCGEVR